MVPTIKAIETQYNGYRFRSRLEARWAVFMDTMGVKYEYEPEGFNIDGTRYLPDFWLPEVEAWLEIKGPQIQVGDVSWDKAILLCDASGSDVFVFCGQFPIRAVDLMGMRFSVWIRPGDNQEDSKASGLERVIVPDNVWWFKCPTCGRFQIGKTIADLPCGCVDDHHPDRFPDVRLAVLAARQARFERF